MASSTRVSPAPRRNGAPVDATISGAAAGACCAASAPSGGRVASAAWYTASATVTASIVRVRER